MSVASRQRADQPHSRHAAGHNRSPGTSEAAALADNRPEAVAQRQLAAAIDSSPRQAVQRKQIQGLFGAAVQRTGGPAGTTAQAHVSVQRTVQRRKVSEDPPPVGPLLLEKHIGDADAVSAADLHGDRAAQENALEAVYYQRPKSDRRDVNTVLFVDAADLQSDLNETNAEVNLDEQSAYTRDFTTSRNYFAVSVLRVWKQKPGYVKAVISYGDAKPVVKLNKQGGLSWNHLQATDPKKLPTEVDLTPQKQKD